MSEGRNENINIQLLPENEGKKM